MRLFMSTRNKPQHAADLHRNHMDRLPGNQVAAETANTANTVLLVTRRVRDITSKAEANSQEHFSHHKAKRSSPQLGETAEKVQSFLSAHRPTSPNSRTGSPSPTSPVNNYQQDQLITAMDVLQHFTEHGLDAIPKLVHCVPAQALQDTAAAGHSSKSILTSSAGKLANGRCWEPSQYELQVVQRSQLPNSYWTVSATGVVQASNGSHESQHTPIGQWVREGNMFRIMRSLPAFSQLWQGTTLRRWHANVRRIIFERNQKQLAKQLLHLKPAYLRVLTETRNRLTAVQETDVLQQMPPGLYTLEALIETQQDHQSSKLAPLIARTIAAIIADIEQLASRLQTTEQVLGRELHEYNKDPSAGATQGLNSIKIRAERDAIAAKHAAALYDLQRLPAFIRLLGLHVLQSHLDVLMAAVTGLKAQLELPGNTLLVNILLAQDGVKLSPSMEELLKGLSKDVVEHLVYMLKAAPRPLKHPAVVSWLEDPVRPVPKHLAGLSMTGARIPGQYGITGPNIFGARASQASDAGSTAAAHAADGASLPPFLHDDDQNSEGGTLLLMMVGDQKLGLLRRAIDQQVMRSYREASVVTDTLADLSVLLNFARVWDPASYKAKQYTVAQLRKDMLLLREWQAQLQVVLDKQSVGLLQLQTGFLKTTYMAKLASAQATVAMLLASAARRECQEVITQLHDTAREVSQQPSKLVEFISFKLRVKDVWQQREQLSVMKPGQVQLMYATAADWASAGGGKLPHTDQVLLDDLKEAVRNFNRALTAAMAFIDSRQTGMMAVLDRHAKELMKKIQELLKQLEVASLAQRLGTSASGLQALPDKLAAWQRELQLLEQSSVTMNCQEAQLGCRPTQNEELIEVRRVLEEIRQGLTAGEGTDTNQTAASG